MRDTGTMHECTRMAGVMDTLGTAAGCRACMSQHRLPLGSILLVCAHQKGSFELPDGRMGVPGSMAAMQGLPGPRRMMHGGWECRTRSACGGAPEAGSRCHRQPPVRHAPQWPSAGTRTAACPWCSG